MSLPVLVHAQILPVELTSSVQKAVQRNPEVLARLNGFKASDQAQQVAAGGLLPQLDLNTRMGGEKRETSAIDYGRYTFNSTQLSLRQMLFDGQSASNEVKKMIHMKMGRYHEWLDATEATSLEALRAYLDVLRYRNLAEAAKTNFLEHQQTTLQINNRTSAGLGRGADLDQANGRLALAESNLLTELANLHDVSSRYLRVTGSLPPSTMPALPEPFELVKLPASLNELLVQAIRKNPALNAAGENVHAVKFSEKASAAAFKPRVDLRGYIGRDDHLAGLTGKTMSSGVELTLNYNFSRGGSDVARQQQAVHLSDQAINLHEKTCRDTQQVVTIAYNDVQSLSKQLGYLNQHRMISEKLREAYRQQFTIGQRSLLDLLNNQNEYFEATRAYINAKYNLIYAQGRVLASTGDLANTLGVATQSWLSAPLEMTSSSSEVALQCVPQSIHSDLAAQIDAIRK